MCEFTLKNGKQCQGKHKQGLYCWRHQKAEEQKSDDVCVDLTEEEEECGVCYEPLKGRDTYTCPQCKDELCMECIVMTIHLTSRRKCPMCRFVISIPKKELKAFTKKQLKNNPSPQFRNAMSQPSRRARARRAEATRRVLLARIAEERRAEDYALAVAYSRTQDQLQELQFQRALRFLSLEYAREAQAQAGGLYSADRALFEATGLYRAH
jgi:hypothetical protein